MGDVTGEVDKEVAAAGEAEREEDESSAVVPFFDSAVPLRGEDGAVPPSAVSAAADEKDGDLPMAIDCRNAARDVEPPMEE